jgi:hypothetical protein
MCVCMYVYVCMDNVVRQELIGEFFDFKGEHVHTYTHAFPYAYISIRLYAYMPISYL